MLLTRSEQVQGQQSAKMLLTELGAAKAELLQRQKMAT